MTQIKISTISKQCGTAIKKIPTLKKKTKQNKVLKFGTKSRHYEMRSVILFLIHKHSI